MEHVPDRSTLRGNVVYTDHYVSTFLRWRYFLRRYSFPYDESKGIDARNIMGRRGEKPRCFYTHYRITLRISASYQDLNILITSNLVDFPFFFFFCPSDSGDLLERNAGKKYISCAYFSTRAAHKKTRCIFSWSNGSFPRRARRRPDPPKIRESPPWKASSRVWGQARLNERHEAYRGRGTQPSLRRKWRSWYICSSPITHLVLAYSPIAPPSLLPFAPSSRLIFLPALICATPRLFLALSHRRAAIISRHRFLVLDSYSGRCIYVRGSRLAGFTLNA